jgi:hypothetical protein
MSGRQQRVMVQPIVRSTFCLATSLVLISHPWQNVIFKNLQQVSPRGRSLRYILTIDLSEVKSYHLAL